MSWHMSVVVLLLLLPGLTACKTIADQKWAVPTTEQPGYPGASTGIRIIQIDEGAPKQADRRPGKFFDEADLSSLKSWLDKGRGAPIVVYIHGWHHNASRDKNNLASFRSFIAQLDGDVCQVASLMDQERMCSPVQGIYVGWRGDSLDTLILADVLDVVTFGSRKQASKRVGVGHLQKVLQLVSAYKDRDVFIAGHSLGANALYHAVHAQGGLEVQDRHDYFMLNPATTSEEFEVLSSRMLQVAGRAALDVTALQRAQARIERREHRKLTVIQSDSDWVVGSLFRIAYGMPIGFDDDRRTHLADAVPLSTCPTLSAQPITGYCSVKLESGLTIRVSEPYESHCEAAFGAEAWVVLADPTFSSSHGDIWGPEQRCALAELIAKRVNRVPGY